MKKLSLSLTVLLAIVLLGFCYRYFATNKTPAIIPSKTLSIPVAAVTVKSQSIPPDFGSCFQNTFNLQRVMLREARR